MESRASLAIRTSASSALEVSGSLRTAGTMTPHTAAHSKHQELSDAYLSELLSYSLDRLKKVRDPLLTLPGTARYCPPRCSL